MRWLILLYVISVCSGCDKSSGLCGNDIVQTAKSPDGSRVAVLFTRDCGATTATSTQVSVLNSKEPLSGSANAFVADDNHGAVDTSSTGAIRVALRWVAADRLSISSMTPKLREVYQAEGPWQDVIAHAMQLPPNTPELIREMWTRNLEIAKRNNATLAPQQFAEMFVDQNWRP